MLNTMFKLNWKILAESSGRLVLLDVTSAEWLDRNLADDLVHNTQRTASVTHNDTTTCERCDSSSSVTR